MRRWRERLDKDGYTGLADRRKGKPSAQLANSAGVDFGALLGLPFRTLIAIL